MEEFKVGERASHYVGSDCYAGEVVSVTPSQVAVRFSYGEETFTKRKDGRFRLKGKKFGTLSKGGETHLDPSF